MLKITKRVDGACIHSDLMAQWGLDTLLLDILEIKHTEDQGIRKFNEGEKFCAFA